jgi:hypothetical protein
MFTVGFGFEFSETFGTKEISVHKIWIEWQKGLAHRARDLRDPQRFHKSVQRLAVQRQRRRRIQLPHSTQLSRGDVVRLERRVGRRSPGVGRKDRRRIESVSAFTLPLLAKVSFPDYDVDAFRFSPHERRLEIVMSGAWLDVDGGRDLGPSALIIGDWTRIESRSYDIVSKAWEKQDVPVALKDLCEAEFREMIVTLRGFATDSGLWTELLVTCPSILLLQRSN